MKSENDRLMAATLLSAAGEVEKNRNEMMEASRSREQSSRTVKELTAYLEARLGPAVQLATSEGDPAVLLSGLISSIRDSLQGLRNLGESLSLDATRLGGRAEGIAEAGEKLRDMGNHLLREAERVEALAESDSDSGVRRKPGERPESLRVKRKAESLRQNHQPRSDPPACDDK